MLKLIRSPTPARLAAERLHASAVRRARLPALYARFGAPDTVEGRFEMLSVHIILLIERLTGQDGAAAETRQLLFDAFVSHLDGAMREMGVGDLAMAKRMRRLGEAFYGRLQSYSLALERLPDTGELAAVVARTILEGSDASPQPLATYLAGVHASLRAQSADELFSGEPAWGQA
jgi:cytochrome b pre-mRNA-processing protein 3